MVILFNLLLPTILLVVVWIGYRSYKKKKENNEKIGVVLKTIAVMCFISIIYSNVQPSYLPKGTVPSLTKVPLEETKKLPIQNRTEIRSDREREERVKEILTVRDEVRAVLKEEKKENGN